MDNLNLILISFVSLILFSGCLNFDKQATMKEDENSIFNKENNLNEEKEKTNVDYKKEKLSELEKEIETDFEKDLDLIYSDSFEEEEPTLVW